ncbi:MAG: tetratricopeptide repeat protein, partial [Polyangiaceae bacterium]
KKAAAVFEPDPAFGEIDLPAVGASLPAISASLPAIAASLPAISASLPQVAAALPANIDSLPVMAAGLPATQQSLPANVDSLPVMAASLPAPQQSLPANIESLPVTAESLPIRSSAPPAEILAQDDLGDFGELDLPPGPLSNPPGARVSNAPVGRMSNASDEMSVGRAGDFGDLFGPSEPRVPVAAPSSPNDPFGDAIASVSGGASLPPPAHKASGGGMAFGEVDLGDGPSGGAEIISAIPEEAPIPSGPPPVANMNAVAASLAPGGGLLPTEVAIAAAPTRTRTSGQDEEKRRGRARWIGGGILVLALGGAALELTPYGAFGRYPISDLIHASDYQRATMAAAAAARTQLLSDTFPDSKNAVDAVDSAHKSMPRARALTAYLAISELGHQLRFGIDPDRSAHARVALGEIPPGTETKYSAVANALQDALGADLAKGRASLDAASKRDPGDPVQEDIAYARGALELRARDGKAAQAAFEKALAMRPSDAAKNARAHYGLAAAHLLLGDIDPAKKEADLAIAASPKHVGARFLKARIAWENDHDDTTALDALTSILEGAFKDSASPTEQANALSLRGDIQAARGRSADARAAYDAALKLEARNVDALIGQGEVLFSEGRFTEALSRFDTAVQADPLSVRAILSDAKGKIALEKLADAKAQLTAARAVFPKDMRIAVELGKSDEALGNKPAAEHEYLSAIDLVDVTKTEAIEPYVALAALLAGEGRTKDAEAKLEEARTRLQDSAPMQRALGEVAAAQGNFDDAVTHYLSAIQKNPTDTSTKFLLGVTYRRMGKMDLASTQFDDVVASDKDYPGLALERGLLYEASGDVDKALEQFQSALAKAPDDPDLNLRVGAAYVAIGRPADAIPVLKKVLSQRPDSGEANHYLGRAIFLQGGSTQADAMRYLKRAVELDPNRAEYHLYVGWAANNAVPAQLGLAKDEIEKALSLDKLLGDAYWQRGVLEQKEGSIEDAIRDLKRALELKPTRVDAHATLAQCYDNKNDQTTALAEWQKAITGNDRMPEWQLHYGKLLLDRGTYSEAAKH